MYHIHSINSATLLIQSRTVLDQDHRKAWVGRDLKDCPKYLQTLWLGQHYPSAKRFLP